MAVALRLARTGMKGQPSYRVVATTKGTKRDGKFLEIVGTYDPGTTPSKINLKENLIRKWIATGALPTEVVRSLIKKSVPGLIEEIEKKRLDKKIASRKARKARAKSRK